MQGKASNSISTIELPAPIFVSLINDPIVVPAAASLTRGDIGRFHKQPR